jgi:hypothetical protein
MADVSVDEVFNAAVGMFSEVEPSADVSESQSRKVVELPL